MMTTAQTYRRTPPPKRIGKYTILSKMGEGGMSSVYKANHPGLNRNVIIKELKQLEEDQAALRFQREARIMMDLRHDNIVQVHDYFIERGRRYIVMEFVDGISLETLLVRERILPIPMALLITREVARALKHAHDRGIIHRDVKPANIMISRTGTVKLTDFGIATSREDAEEGLTICGMTLGTPAYMSPEQFISTRDVSRQADIYSLGITLYEMLCGRRPFPGSFTPETITAIRDGRCKKPGSVNPELPMAIIRLIRRAMHRKPKRRFRDLQIFIRKLGRRLRPFSNIIRAHEYIRTRIWPEKQQTLTPVSKNRKRQRRHLILSASIILFLSGLGLYSGQSGLLRELFYSSTHGALTVRVAVNPAFFPDSGRPLHCTMRLLPQKKGGEPFSLSLHQEKPAKPGTILSSGKQHLPAGDYTLVLHIENQVIQKELHLQPYREQKTNGGPELMEFRASRPRQVPVHIFYRTRDAQTAKEITGITRFSIYYFGWHKWNDFLKRTGSDKLLVSGKEFLFRFEAKGYRSRTERIRLSRSQNRLQLELSLQRKLPPLP